MSKDSSKGLPSNLPKDFFDTSKKSSKVQEDELAKELEQFEKEMAALQAESEDLIQDEFEKLQDEKDSDELNQQMDQWKRILELEKRAEELKSKSTNENPTKKFKNDSISAHPQELSARVMDIDEQGLEDIEDFEDKLFDWRSKGL